MNTETEEKNELKENKELVLFENSRIRRKEYKGEWLYSVVDIIAILSESERPEKYWNDLKKKIEKEGLFELSEKIGRLKMIAKKTYCWNSRSNTIKCYRNKLNLATENNFFCTFIVSNKL